jgi:inhibitor of KinA sporulation pathway (predicted exonuclease)
MNDFPPQFILFDTEFTTWEGASGRNWTGPNEHREIVQIGAILVNNQPLEEVDSFVCLIQPKINPLLSDYFIQLTGISQASVDMEGLPFVRALTEFRRWCGDTIMYSYGYDGKVIEENCALLGIPSVFPEEQCIDIRTHFVAHGIVTENYSSGTIVKAFGQTPSRNGHDAQNDARTILDGLRLLRKKVEENGGT